MYYKVMSYGRSDTPLADPESHDNYSDRGAAESECRRLVREGGRYSAHAVRELDGTTVYKFDQVDLAGYTPTWTIELADRLILAARPTGALFLRTLINEGGRASAERLRDILGVKKLGPFLNTLTSAKKRVFQWPESRDVPFVTTVSDRDTHLVTEYVLASDAIPFIDGALRRQNK